MSKPVYAVENLVIDLYTPTVSVRAVDGASFAVHAGETLAVVGESGSGKTVMTLGPLGLMPEGVAVDLKGTARVDGRNIVEMSSKELSGVRGKDFGVIFQDPMSALNPMLKIGRQIAEQAQRFTGVSAEQAKSDAISLLARTGIPDPEDRFDRYPHELSGGMLQRAMIALALASKPRVLIADEPTTALDATVQAQILDLIQQVQKQDGLSVVLITHDIGAVSAIADRVMVLYAGQIVEEGDAEDVLVRPVHPYTRGLLASVPDFRSKSASGTREIPGLPPNQTKLEPGCRFAPRCAKVVESCHVRRPTLVMVGQGEHPHRAACPVVIAEEGVRP